jgi:hypothetical protein
MHCQQCGKFFTRGPRFYPGTNNIVCHECYPFQCAKCQTTKKQAYMVLGDEDWCFPCYDKRLMREDGKFGEPGDGTLFTETL